MIAVKIAIVDDEPEVREMLSQYLFRFAEEKDTALEVTPFPCGDAFLAAYQNDYDIIIFDIDMPGRNGIDTAIQLRTIDTDVTILFITNIAQYAINGYEVDAVDYIIKPIGYYDFALKFSKAVRKAQKNRPAQIILDTTDGIVRLAVESILYIESNAHYLIYHTDNATYRVRGSIKEHEAEMTARRFSRVQRSFLINLARVEKINTGEVTVGGMVFSFGRIYKDSFMSDYMKYLGG